MRRTVTFLATLMLLLIAPSARSAQEDLDFRLLGELAMRVIQTGHFLELLTSGSCGTHAQRRHRAAEDVAFVVSTLPGQLKQDSNLSKAITNDGQRLNSYAQREISELSAKLAEKSEGYRCGFLLGIGSVTHYQARRDWAKYLRLDNAVWQLP